MTGLMPIFTQALNFTSRVLVLLTSSASPQRSSKWQGAMVRVPDASVSKYIGSCPVPAKVEDATRTPTPRLSGSAVAKGGLPANPNRLLRITVPATWRGSPPAHPPFAEIEAAQGASPGGDGQHHGRPRRRWDRQEQGRRLPDRPARSASRPPRNRRQALCHSRCKAAAPRRTSSAGWEIGGANRAPEQPLAILSTGMVGSRNPGRTRPGVAEPKQDEGAGQGSPPSVSGSPSLDQTHIRLRWGD